MLKKLILTITAIYTAGLTQTVPDYVSASWNEQWDEMDMFIKGAYAPKWYHGQGQVYEPEMLPKPEDRDPADLVIRRTNLLLEHLKTMDGYIADLIHESYLSTLTSQANSIPITDSTGRRGLFLEACALRRQIAFTNPLLDFNELLFTRYSRTLPQINHGPYASHSTKQGGGIYKLVNPFSDNPSEIDLLTNATVQNGRLQGQKLVPGSFRDVELSYDGSTVYFAYGQKLGGHGSPAPYNDPSLDYVGYYHVFKMGLDGSGLTQLTDSKIWDEHSPVELPNGRIVYLSGARNSGQRCWGNHPAATSNLYSMKSDGSDAFCINWHETNQWEPSVNHDGMLVYTQWDYIDKDAWLSQAFWISNPDGTDPRSPSANYAVSGHWTCGHNNSNPVSFMTAGWWIPKAVVYIRAIPGSQLYSAVSCGHCQGIFGPIITVDTRIPEDDPSEPQINLVTLGEYHITPWPLNEKFYLSVCKPAHEPIGGYTNWAGWDQNQGLYLVDCFGNKEILWKSPGLAPRDPFPLKPRTKPPVIPEKTFQGERASDPGHRRATISVMDVYNSDIPLPEGTVIKELRIIQIVPFLRGDISAYTTGYARCNMGRYVIGTVPVEEDGSVYFEAPIEKEIYFQLLDENGLAVQSMRAGTYVHPGEHLSCTGCHENKWEAIPINPNPLAMQRLPSKITPEPEGSAPFHFTRLVQPVLDAKCQPCHQQNSALDLSGGIAAEDLPKGMSWSQSYWNLRDYAFWYEQFGKHSLNTSNPLNRVDPSNPLHASRSIPGQAGAMDSRLYKEGYLGSSHYNLQLTSEELRRITLWLDINSNFHGMDFELAKQATGEVVWPLGDVDPDNPTGVEKDYPVVPVKEPGNPGASGRVSELTVSRGFLSYSLPTAGYVKIEVFNTAGKQLAVLDNCLKALGTYTLRLPKILQPGTVYIFRLRTGGSLVSQKYLSLNETQH